MSDTFDDICRELSADSVYQALDRKSTLLETVSEIVVGATNSHAACFLKNDDKRDYFCALSTRVEEQLSPSIRILIADDYKDWRVQVRLLLQARLECQVRSPEHLCGTPAVYSQ